MNWYISVNPETLTIEDRFHGNDDDVSSRSSRLEHIVVPGGFDYSVSRNPETNEFEVATHELPDTSMDKLRIERNLRLKQSDWFVSIPDLPISMEKVQEWKSYRQALRDLPANTTDPNKPEWPTPPE